jgi:hypothetical protein
MLDMPKNRKRMIPGIKNESKGDPARIEAFILRGLPDES